MDQCDVMDYIDDELAALLAGHDSPDAAGCPLSSNVNVPPPPPPSSVPMPAATASAVEPPPPPLVDDRASSITPPLMLPVILNFANYAESSAADNSGVADDDFVFAAKINNPDRGETAAAMVFGKTQKGGRRRVRPPSQTYDHIMAERRRREQLSRYFVALSAIVPGLKKMDKTSILGDTITYLKLLQERVKTLEERTNMECSPPVLIVETSEVVDDQRQKSSSSSVVQQQQQTLPEITAHVCDDRSHVLIKIHCGKRKGILIKILAQVENLNLSIVNTSVTPFGNLALDITVIAQTNQETSSSLGAKDIINTLRAALVASNNSINQLSRPELI